MASDWKSQVREKLRSPEEKAVEEAEAKRKHQDKVLHELLFIDRQVRSYLEELQVMLKDKAAAPPSLGYAYPKLTLSVQRELIGIAIDFGSLTWSLFSNHSEVKILYHDALPGWARVDRPYSEFHWTGHFEEMMISFAERVKRA